VPTVFNKVAVITMLVLAATDAAHARGHFDRAAGRSQPHAQRSAGYAGPVNIRHYYAAPKSGR
jgi:hypothetical protein